ncbi:CBS domain-containing protein [Flavobacteriaceae bacterium XHP0103]|uniref:CBS domain-containing protein n=1 Tax=Marixanthotalea marina TaxID=2844359 RepID=UPI002989F035|nr:CBS domain-containing protein [Marixanthotalea marina]MBU3821920.1 CBS domain-containing protein [Marixanthotalea marina]
MVRRTPVSEIMTKNIIAISRSEDLNRAEALFKKYKIRHLPVVSGESIVGMLSYADLLKIGYADTSNDEHNIETVIYNLFTIEQVMTKDVVCIDSSTTIKDATEIIAQSNFHALPVVEDAILVGIVTSTDLLKYYLKQF